MHPHITNLRPIEQYLHLAGCRYDSRRRAWQCPVCRWWAVLRITPMPDGADWLRCDSGCAEGQVLDKVGATAFDIAPTCFRLGDRP